MDLHARLRWFGQVALLAFVLGAAAFLSAITAIRLAIRGREVQVPSVVGMRTGDAQAALAGRRLGVQIADRVYSDQPPDRVVRQSPPPGTNVKVWQRVHVVLSLGPRKVPIPALVGKSLRAARIELLRAGLQVGEVSTCRLSPALALLALNSAEESPSQRIEGAGQPQPEPERVVQQSPLPGEPAAAGAESARVNLLVALAPEEPSYVMPDLGGLPLAEAQRRISEASLRLGKITAVPARLGEPAGNAPRGVVLQQKPASGARIRASTAVELEVSE